MPSEESAIDKGNRFARTLQAHVVSLGCTNQSEEPPRVYQYSAFVVSIGDAWILVTAGHNIENVDRALAAGKQLSHWHIDDCSAPNRITGHPIMFDFRRDKVGLFCDTERGWDYAFVGLDYLTQRGLELSGIRALDERAWNCPPLEQIDFLYVIGQPEKLTKNAAGPIMTKSYVCMKAEWLKDRPPCLDQTTLPRIYGSIDEAMNEFGGGLDDIVGMSGGPVFAVKDDGQGNLSYWVAGLLSAQNRGERKIAVCPLAPMLRGCLAAYISGPPNTTH